MNLGIDGFNWDSGNSEKIKTHGLSRKEVEAFFQQESVYVAPDIKHSEKEERYLAVGSSSKGRPMLVVFTFRENEEERLIRPISARYMQDKEAKRYEEESAKIEKR
ncbi:MAG: BrnT family toxin [Nitrospinae bacterium]|nr:BrnT family toxin [Nitrospinota bacterium]